MAVIERLTHSADGDIYNHVLTELPNNKGWLPLHAACTVGHLQAVKHLIKVCMKDDDFHAKSLKIVGLIPGSSDNALALACRGCFANVVAELLKYISLEPRLENPMDYVFIVLNSTHSQTPKHHAANSVQPSLQIEVIKELADRIASISDSELNEVVRLASDKITWNANTHTAVCDVDILLKPLLTSEVLKDHLRIKNEELTSSDVTLKHAVPQYVYDKACPFEASQLLLRGIPKQKSEVWNWMNFKEVRVFRRLSLQL